MVSSQHLAALLISDWSRLALNIASGENKGGGGGEGSKEGSVLAMLMPVSMYNMYVPHLLRYIVVETNYRIYAYTDSNLQIALLGLFTEILYR